MTRTVIVPDRPAAFEGAPRRYWGERKPPKNRADFWSYAAHQVPVTPEDAAPGAAAVETRTVATLRIYGPIDSWGGWWGVSARDVSAALDELGDVDEVRVRINSPGGDAWEGMAILNMLRAHGATYVAVVDGIAASAASYIAAGAEQTVMSPGTQMMIHDASAFAYGDAATMRQATKFLDSVSDAISSIYAGKAGGTDADWRALMVETTWYTAAEAVAAKLADQVAVVSDAGTTDTAGADEEDLDGDEIDTDVEDAFDLSMYRTAGRSHAGPPPMPPAAPAPGSTRTEGGSAVAYSDEQLTTMRQTLDLPKDATVADIVAALGDQGDTEQPAADPAAGPEPVNPPTSAVPDGMVQIPKTAFDEMQRNGQLGAQAAERLRVQDRDAYLDSRRDRFVPANRDAWAKQYDTNPEGTRAYLDNAPVLVPLDELGHGTDGDQPVDVTDTDAYKEWKF